LPSTFSSSSLVRLLGDWAPLGAPVSGMDFAERLSLWLNAFDAIGLQAAHQSIRAITTTAPAASTRQARPPGAGDLAEDLRRVRAALGSAIAREPIPPAVDRLALAGHSNRPAGSPAPSDGYAPYQQRHLELQRQMEQMIAPLRDHVRQALCRISPRLRQLAALDAVVEHVIAPREQALLPTAAALLQRRFEQLRQAHRQELEAAGQQDEPAGGRGDEWLDAFARDWRRALLAEVDLRLEPVAGLIDALDNELKNRP
jgi:hypothetical protein